ncbi:hypothetical protein CRG98_029929 [Punica granatum]|uniref:Uncharacterized protein n=1 Tax=Punica granatum TaxID=22663 RepID=A0A2I0J0D1_PUNGR|nr:hypothetical protein CRG98_029929 [Punica granatum]
MEHLLNRDLVAELLLVMEGTCNFLFLPLAANKMEKNPLLVWDNCLLAPPIFLQHPALTWFRVILHVLRDLNHSTGPLVYIHLPSLRSLEIGHNECLLEAHPMLTLEPTGHTDLCIYAQYTALITALRTHDCYLRL